MVFRVLRIYSPLACFEMPEASERNSVLSEQPQWTPELAIPNSILALPAPLSFFRILRFLKTQRRTGWLDRGIESRNAESISDHMYRMAVMCMLAPQEDELDSRKCAMIALVHDLAEAVVGDLTPSDPVGPGLWFRLFLFKKKHQTNI